MKLLLHNFRITLRRLQLYSLLNIVGLSIAFTVAMVVAIQVGWEYNYGKSDPNHEEIFRVEIDMFDKGYDLSLYPIIYKHLINDEPRVKSFLATNRMYSYSQVAASKNGNFASYPMLDVHFPLDCFTFEVVEGSMDAINDPDAAIIPQSFAQKLFPDGGALGSEIFYKGEGEVEAESSMTIGCVYRDLPSNSGLTNAIMSQSYKRYGESIYNYFYPIHSLFIRTDNDPENLKAIVDNLYKVIESDDSDRNRYIRNRPIRLNPLDDIYFSDYNYGFRPITLKGDKKNTHTMIYIALFIMIIALINFVNLSTALATKRLRSLNTRFVFGETKNMLRLSIVVEAIGFALIAYVVSLVMLLIIPTTSIMELLIVNDLSLSANSTIIACAFAAAIAVGVIAGLYPAIYSTHFSPALALKSSNGGGKSGGTLRSILICVQSTVSIILIIYTLFIYFQNEYMKSADQGFERENIVKVDVFRLRSDSDLDIFSQKLLTSPAVESVSYIVGGIGENEGMLAKTDVELQTKFLPCDSNLLSTLKIPIIEGQNFGERSKDLQPIIINRTMQIAYNLSVDSIISNRYKIIGVCEDYITHTLKEPISPMAFVWMDIESLGYFNYGYIRINSANFEQAIAHIQSVCEEMIPTQLFSYELLDQHLSHLYQKEEQYSLLIAILSLVAIAITLLGVVGLILFEMQFRRREIALRKVHGATVNQILRLIYRRFFVINVIAIVVALPISYIVVQKWISQFAFNIGLSPMLFIAGTMIVYLSIAAVVVSLTISSATSNPINSLKTE